MPAIVDQARRITSLTNNQRDSFPRNLYRPRRSKGVVIDAETFHQSRRRRGKEHRHPSDMRKRRYAPTESFVGVDAARRGRHDASLDYASGKGLRFRGMRCRIPLRFGFLCLCSTGSLFVDRMKCILVECQSVPSLVAPLRLRDVLVDCLCVVFVRLAFCYRCTLVGVERLYVSCCGACAMFRWRFLVE